MVNGELEILQCTVDMGGLALGIIQGLYASFRTASRALKVLAFRAFLVEGEGGSTKVPDAAEKSL